MHTSHKMRLGAIRFRRLPEVPRRQVKPCSQKIERSPWLDPPESATYNDVGSTRAKVRR